MVGVAGGGTGGLGPGVAGGSGGLDAGAAPEEAAEGGGREECALGIGGHAGISSGLSILKHALKCPLSSLIYLRNSLVTPMPK